MPQKLPSEYPGTVNHGSGGRQRNEPPNSTIVEPRQPVIYSERPSPSRLSNRPTSSEGLVSAWAASPGQLCNAQSRRPVQLLQCRRRCAMGKCAFCGADTRLFDGGIPICLDCHNDPERRREYVQDRERERAVDPGSNQRTEPNPQSG